jgi:hypothetical protein
MMSPVRSDPSSSRRIWIRIVRDRQTSKSDHHRPILSDEELGFRIESRIFHPESDTTTAIRKLVRIVGSSVNQKSASDESRIIVAFINKQVLRQKEIGFNLIRFSFTIISTLWGGCVSSRIPPK